MPAGSSRQHFNSLWTVFAPASCQRYFRGIQDAGYPVLPDFFHPFKLRKYSYSHSDKACQSSDYVWNRFCHEYAVCSQFEYIGQQIGKRNHHDYLSEQTKKYCLFLFIQRLENSLPWVLERLKYKSKEIQVERPKRQLLQSSIIAENPDKKQRSFLDQYPHETCI